MNYKRVDVLRKGAQTYGLRFVAPDAYLVMPWAGTLQVRNLLEFTSYVCRDAKVQGFSCSYSSGYLTVRNIDQNANPEMYNTQDTSVSMAWRVDPCNGSLMQVSSTLTDSLLSLSDSLRCPSVPKSGPSASRPLVVRVSGLLRSSSRRLGVRWSDLLLTASQGDYSFVWSASALASDSLGTLDFARSLSFAVRDSGSVTFGAENRRPTSTISRETGQTITEFESVFDGLSVAVNGLDYVLTYRQGSSVLSVPSEIGKCAIGIADLTFDSVSGLPWLGALPYVGYLFSYHVVQTDEMAVTVCVKNQ